MRIFVLEIGRPVVESVKKQIGEPDKVLSIQRSISELEIPLIVSKAYRFIQELAEEGEEVLIVLSGPLALAFQLGQAIGLGKFKVKVVQYMMGQYREVPPLTRKLLFGGE